MPVPDTDGSPPVERTMTLSRTPTGSAVVLAVAGELDLHTAPELMEAVDAELDDPRVDVVVVDLSAVDFLGSSGLGVLAGIATRAVPPSAPADAPPRPPTPVRVVAPPDHRPVTRPWEAMNLQQVLPLHPDVAAALDPR